ncbi:MAG: acyl carrier protein [Pelolinea sp.]|nr:acyl carrier protein [Pelolinea sp.]
MEKAEIIKLIGSKIASEILKQPEKVITPDEPLISSGLIDSFSLVDLALQVEELFGVRIEDFELNVDTFDNLNQLAEIVLSRKK